MRAILFSELEPEYRPRPGRHLSFLKKLENALFWALRRYKSSSVHRAACRKFLVQVDDPYGDIMRFGSHMGHFASWKFNGAIGELRDTFGIYIAKIAVAYGIDIEEDLASIIPREDID